MTQPTVPQQSTASREPPPPVRPLALLSSDPILRLQSSWAGFGVIVSGELDLSSVGLLRSVVAATCGQDFEPHADFVLDLRDLTFLDSAGVHELALVQEVVCRRGWDLQVVAPTAVGPCRLIRLAENRGWLPRSTFARPAA